MIGTCRVTVKRPPRRSEMERLTASACTFGKQEGDQAWWRLLIIAVPPLFEAGQDEAGARCGIEKIRDVMHERRGFDARLTAFKRRFAAQVLFERVQLTK